MSVIDAIYLLDYDYLLYDFVEKFKTIKDKKELLNKLDLLETLTYANSYGKTKKGNIEYNIWHRNLIDKLNDLNEKEDKTIFDKLKKFKNNKKHTIFNKLKRFKLEGKKIGV